MVVQVLVGGRGLGKRKGAIDMGRDLACSIPGKDLLSRASEQVGLVPEVSHIHPKDALVFVYQAERCEAGHCQHKA